MVQPAAPVEFVKISSVPKLRGVTVGSGITYLSSGLFRGRYCEVVSRTLIQPDTMVPITDLREMFGAFASAKSYTIFEYTPQGVSVAAVKAEDTPKAAGKPVKKAYEPDNFAGIDVFERGRSLC